jgi:hypothetical protein
MGNYRITLSRHAELVLAERNISRDWVDLAIDQPDIVEPDPQRANVFRAFRSIPERKGRVLRVAYTRSETEIRVITAFFDRAMRR